MSIVYLILSLAGVWAEDANKITFLKFEAARILLEKNGSPIKSCENPLLQDDDIKIRESAPTFDDNGLTFYTIELSSEGFKRWVNLWVAHKDGIPSVVDLRKFLKNERPASPLVISRILTCSKNLKTSEVIYFDSGAPNKKK